MRFAGKVLVTFLALATLTEAHSVQKPPKCDPAASSPYTCGADTKGRCYTDTDDNLVYFCNGTSNVTHGLAASPTFTGTMTTPGGTITSTAATFTVPIIASPQSFTIADDGAGTVASGTLLATSSAVGVTCSDANGCNITLSETGMVSGMELRIVNISANTVNFADSSGVTETAGAFAAGQWDAITFMYAVDRWVEMARSNN
jgi:hypothetical protein